MASFKPAKQDRIAGRRFRRGGEEEISFLNDSQRFNNKATNARETNAWNNYIKATLRRGNKRIRSTSNNNSSSRDKICSGKMEGTMARLPYTWLYLLYYRAQYRWQANHEEGGREKKEAVRNTTGGTEERKGEGETRLKRYNKSTSCVLHFLFAKQVINNRNKHIKSPFEDTLPNSRWTVNIIEQLYRYIYRHTDDDITNVTTISNIEKRVKKRYSRTEREKY